MATIIRYVNPDSSGGDGTTTATSGAQAAYTSLSAGEAAQQQDLTDGAGDIAECICQTGGTADTTAVTINGWTTSATCYINIYAHADHRHAGKWSDAKYRMSTTAFNGLVVTINEEYVRAKWLQIDCSGAGGNAGGVYVNTSAGDVQIGYAVVRGNTSADTIGIWRNDGTMTVYNCVVYNCAQCLRVPYAVYNCTLVTRSGSGYNAIYAQYNAVIASNVIGIVQGTSPNAFFLSTGTINNCVSSDSTADNYTGSNNQVDKELADYSFVDADNFDFHLAADDAVAKDLGVVNPGSGLFSDDIDGVSRPVSGTWCIGADEYVAAGGGGSNPWYYYAQMGV